MNKAELKAKNKEIRRELDQAILDGKETKRLKAQLEENESQMAEVDRRKKLEKIQKLKNRIEEQKQQIDRADEQLEEAKKEYREYKPEFEKIEKRFKQAKKKKERLRQASSIGAHAPMQAERKRAISRLQDEIKQLEAELYGDKEFVDRPTEHVDQNFRKNTSIQGRRTMTRG